MFLDLPNVLQFLCFAKHTSLLLETGEIELGFGSEAEDEVEDGEAGDEAESVGTHLPVVLQSDVGDVVGDSGFRCHALRRHGKNTAHHGVGAQAQLSNADWLGREQRHESVDVKLEEGCASVCRFEGRRHCFPPAAVIRHGAPAPQMRPLRTAYGHGEA